MTAPHTAPVPCGVAARCRSVLAAALSCLALAAVLPVTAALAVPNGAVPSPPSPPSPPGQVSVVDDTGKAITLARPARRIIALYGAYNEILIAMGLGPRLVARTAADTEPPFLAALPAVGTHMRPNLELVTGLQPDLVLQMGGRGEAMESVAALERLGVTVAFFHISSFDELYSVITRLGTLTGAGAEAATLVGSLRGRLERVHETLARTDRRPTVFFELRYPNLLGAGPDSMAGAVIEAAGGVNALADAPQGRVSRVTEEELIRRDPEYYIIQHGPMNKNPVPLDQRPHFTPLRALKNTQWALVDEKMFSRPGPRTVDAVVQLARILHPQLFSTTDHWSQPASVQEKR